MLWILREVPRVNHSYASALIFINGRMFEREAEVTA